MDRRESEAALQGLYLGPQLDAHLGVEIGQGFVEKQDLRLDGESTTERDALALTAGEVRHLPLLEPGQVEHLENGSDAAADLVLSGTPRRRRP